ncbi:XRE family transcriptional regulator [Streptococcus ruminantium]|uniref:XRE family transcriptional regulator n=1 Tax=Streptococcus ruminantium TaxID=1917441 RepID=UPI001F1A9A77|nr:XRE family transcriptional regulator [Streptococcus ruminantium]BDD37893.1 repressor [Streptococcus ruminantium]
MTDKELALYIGNKIKEYRKLKGLTQKELAEKVEMGDTTIANYEKGFRTPKKNTLFKLANAFDISIDDLFPPIDKTASSVPQNDVLTHVTDKVVYLDQELEEPRHSAWISHGEQLLKEQSSASTISDNVVDLYDTRKRVTGIVDFSASAGTGVWQDENLGMEVSFYEDDMAEDYDSIGIVMGSSMEPVLKNGDYLFVKVTPDIPNGSISIWQVNGENFVKKFRKNGKPYLQSLNPEFDDIDLNENDDIRPLGVVVEVYREG